MRLPFIKFFPRDWMSDPQLRMVSVAARGLWFECLCIMHMGKRRGYLETANGNRINVDCLCRLVCTYKGEAEARIEVETLMAELVDHGIPSIDEESGVWYSRRMVKDEAKRKKCSEAGRKGGGNPSLCNPSGEEKKDQKPDTRDHISIKVAYKGDVYTSAIPRLNALYRRRETTEWSAKEITALRELIKRAEFTDELVRIEAYFAAMRADHRGQFLRHNIQTLLNNWPGELDKAGLFANQNNTPIAKKTPAYEYDKALNEILSGVRNRPVTERADYIDSCADKFRDTPTPDGFKRVWIRARDIAADDGLLINSKTTQQGAAT